MGFAKKWYAGTYCDVAATSDGWALVVIDGMDVVAYIDNVEVWRQTATEPITYVRCACDTATDTVHAVAQGALTNTARYFNGATEVSKGAVYGIRGVVLTREASDWVLYVTRTAKTYLRWPLAGAAPAVTVNPFVAGTSQGIRYIVGTTPQWAESTVTPGTMASVTLATTKFEVFHTVSGKTVGQSVGPPATAPQIIGYDGTTRSTIFAVQGFDPHIAALSGSRFAICARTLYTDLHATKGAAFALVPTWPAYDPLAQEEIEQLWVPFQENVSKSQTGQPGARQATPSAGLMTDEYQAYLRTLNDVVRTPVNVSSIRASGQSGGSGGGPVGPAAPAIADYLVGTGQVGLPNARTPEDTATVTWDMDTPNRFKAHVVRSAVSTTVIRRTTVEARQPTRPPGGVGSDPLTVAELLALGYWQILTADFGSGPEVVFDSNGDAIPYFVPTP